MKISHFELFSFTNKIFGKLITSFFDETLWQSCKSGRAFRVGFGFWPKVDKHFGLTVIWAWDVFFVLGAQKYNQNNLAALLNFSDLT